MAIIVFILGSIVGSFLNVCIWRMPRGLSIVFPGSHCPYCNNRINWYDNIPLLSYLLLRGHCRDCNVVIHPCYFIVEMLTGLMFLLCLWRWGVSGESLVYGLFFGLLIIASFVDIRWRIIPDEVSLGGAACGLALSFFFPVIQQSAGHLEGLGWSFLGMLCGAAITYSTGVLGTIVFRKEAMGFGDVKIMACIGAFLGWKFALLAFFIAPLFGSLYGVFVLLRRKSHLIPYGPFLSLGAIVALLYGKKILSFLFLI